jgi:hypothetical protein
MEQDIPARLKFLKVNARRASVESVSGLSASYRRTGAKNRFGARIPAVVIRRHQFNQRILAQESIK